MTDGLGKFSFPRSSGLIFGLYDRICKNVAGCSKTLCALSTRVLLLSCFYNEVICMNIDYLSFASSSNDEEQIFFRDSVNWSEQFSRLPSRVRRAELILYLVIFLVFCQVVLSFLVPFFLSFSLSGHLWCFSPEMTHLESVVGRKQSSSDGLLGISPEGLASR